MLLAKLRADKIRPTAAAGGSARCKQSKGG